MEKGDISKSTSSDEVSPSSEKVNDKSDEVDAKGDYNEAEEDQADSKGDSTDAKGLGLFGRSKKKNDEVVMPTKKDAEEYNMKHSNRGYAIIFNHKHFSPRLNLGERRGTDVDRQKLYDTFVTLGFDKDKVLVYDDLPVAKITQTLSKIAEEDHSDNDCIAVAVCSHGDEGLLYGCDGKYRSEALWEPFTADRCPSLAGKPKLFFIQACRGDRLDNGLMMTEVDSNKYYKIPTNADFLIMYSTVAGFFSWRNTIQGSWFIQALCSVLSQLNSDRDLLEILTVVNRKVAFDYMSCVPHNKDMDLKKQIPCITSMLTRKVYFKPKKGGEDTVEKNN